MRSFIQVALLPFLVFANLASADAISDFLAKTEFRDYNRQEIETAAYDYGIPLGQIVAPFADYHKVGMLAFNGSTPYDSLMLKLAIVEHTPADVPIVVYGPKRELKDFADTAVRANGDLNYVQIEDPLMREAGYEEWTADHLGYPVWLKGHTSAPRLGFVQAQYRWGYDPNPEFSRILLAPIAYQIRDFIEFGNMVINAAKKTAYIVQSPRLRDVPNEVYLSTGVTRIVRVPQIERQDSDGSMYPVSIGHADERMIFLSDTLALTDAPEFEALLKKEGYEVRMLPSFKGRQYEYRSYVNARLVNGTAFVPVYGDALDKQALAVYEAAGFKTVPIMAPMTSDVGHGNVHCMTRALPALPNGAKYTLLPGSYEGPY